MKSRVIELLRGDQKITLVGCIHLGTEEYYKNLQESIPNESVVLYEQVVSERNKDLFQTKTTRFQKLLADILGLKTQKDAVTYKPEWIRSDLDLSTITSANNGVLFPKLTDEYVEKLEDELKDINKKYISLLLKLIIPFARLFKLINPAIIDLRNQYVIIDTFKQLEDNKHITILYGDGHLDHFIKEFKKYKFKVSKVRKIKNL